MNNFLIAVNSFATLRVKFENSKVYNHFFNLSESTFQSTEGGGEVLFSK